MGKRITSRTVFDSFGDVARAVHREMVQVVNGTAGEIKGDAQGYARVQTGSMRDSVYVLSRQEDGYGEAVAAAEADNPKVALFDHLDPPESDTEALVPAAVSHAERMELGPHPFLTPAADDNRPAFLYDVKQGIRAAIRRSTKVMK